MWDDYRLSFTSERDYRAALKALRGAITSKSDRHRSVTTFGVSMDRLERRLARAGVRGFDVDEP